MRDFDELPADASPGVVAKANKLLEHWFRRLVYLEVFNIILKGQPGEPETKIHLNEAQIRKITRNERRRMFHG